MATPPASPPRACPCWRTACRARPGRWPASSPPWTGPPRRGRTCPGWCRCPATPPSSRRTWWRGCMRAREAAGRGWPAPPRAAAPSGDDAVAGGAAGGAARRPVARRRPGRRLAARLGCAEAEWPATPFDPFFNIKHAEDLARAEALDHPPPDDLGPALASRPGAGRGSRRGPRAAEAGGGRSASGPGSYQRHESLTRAEAAKAARRKSGEPGKPEVCARPEGMKQ